MIQRGRNGEQRNGEQRKIVVSPQRLRRNGAATYAEREQPLSRRRQTDAVPAISTYAIFVGQRLYWLTR